MNKFRIALATLCSLVAVVTYAEDITQEHIDTYDKLSTKEKKEYKKEFLKLIQENLKEKQTELEKNEPHSMSRYGYKYTLKIKDNAVVFNLTKPTNSKESNEFITAVLDKSYTDVLTKFCPDTLLQELVFDRLNLYYKYTSATNAGDFILDKKSCKLFTSQNKNPALLRLTKAEAPYNKASPEFKLKIKKDLWDKIKNSTPANQKISETTSLSISFDDNTYTIKATFNSSDSLNDPQNTINNIKKTALTNYCTKELPILYMKVMNISYINTYNFNNIKNSTLTVNRDTCKTAMQ